MTTASEEPGHPAPRAASLRRAPEPLTIVVALNGSQDAERAVPVARFLSHRFDRTDGPHITLVLALAENDEPSARTGAQRYLDDVATSLAPIDVRTAVVTGNPTDAIIARVDRSSRPLLCMSTHARVGAGALLLGNIAEAVVHRTAVPVVLVGPACSPPESHVGERLVFCYDASPESDALAVLAIEWAHQLDLAIEVVMVLHRHGAFLGDHDAAEPVRQATAFTARLNEGGAAATLELLDGLEPAHAITSYCESISAPLVMAAGHWRTPLTSKVLGHTSTRIAHHSPCPVLIIPARCRLIDCSPLSPSVAPR